MANSGISFTKRSNENLLQLWRGRDGLKDDDIDPLRLELEQRGLSSQVAEMDDQVAGKDIYGDLPPAPVTYLNFSVPALWVREQWLRFKTAKGIAVEATIQSTQRTQSGFGGAARAEVRYSYQFQGQRYSGRIVRDFSFDSVRADCLVYENHAGDKFPILINRNSPEISYCPSGIGVYDPISFGLRSLVALAVIFGFLRLVVLSALRSQ